MLDYRRGQIMGRGQGMISFGPELFEGIENYILHAQRIGRELPRAMDLLVRAVALTNLHFAQKMALGPVDPRQERPELAWKVPVRRITGRYFFGWKVRRKGLGTWQLYNDSREAYFIEFGIHRNPWTGQPSAQRIRRPVQKISFLKTLKYLEQTKVYHRVWANVFYPPPGRRKGRGFLWHMQPSITMQGGPIIGPKLP